MVTRIPYEEEYENNSFPDFWGNFAHVHMAETKCFFRLSVNAEYKAKGSGALYF